MKFSKESLLELMECDPNEKTEDNLKLISNKISGKRRWSDTYKMIFEFDGKFYMTQYSVGSTESQDEAPYEYEGDEIECFEVTRKEKTIYVYE